MHKAGSVTISLPAEWYNQLYELLQTALGLDRDKAGAISHSLWDILESVDRLYTTTIPTILAGGKANEELRDLLWDIREEFRHIDYHIHNAELTEL